MEKLTLKLFNKLASEARIVMPDGTVQSWEKYMNYWVVIHPFGSEFIVRRIIFNTNPKRVYHQFAIIGEMGKTLTISQAVNDWMIFRFDYEDGESSFASWSVQDVEELQEMLTSPPIVVQKKVEVTLDVLGFSPVHPSKSDIAGEYADDWKPSLYGGFMLQSESKEL